MSEQADIETALARATAAYKLVSAERDALKDANDRAKAAEAERDRLREALKQTEQERDWLREEYAALAKEAARSPADKWEEESQMWWAVFP
jgi:uncharacterized protein (DUF3084 family)